MLSRFDLGRTIALAWVFASLGATVLLGPHLGYRGWMWLAVNDLLCIFGATHEIIVKERRARNTGAPPRRDPPQTSTE